MSRPKKAGTGRPKKKIVLVLVEGKSDRELLSEIISTLYDRIDEKILVYFPVIRRDGEDKGGDITAHIFTSPKNIEKKIYDQFMASFFDQEKIMPKDLFEVIQIVDMDGVYIPDEDIRASGDPAQEHYFYADDGIIVPTEENVEMAKERNRRKRTNLEYLTSLETIKVGSKSVKYSVYYFSCNLDHFFHGNANMDQSDKVLAAWAVNSNYQCMDDGMDRFLNDICKDEAAAVGMTLEESWEHIRQEGHNSLHKGTNINILLERLHREALQAEGSEFAAV